MTEGHRPLVETYEGVRDSFPLGEDGDGTPKLAVLWRSADRWREHYRDEVSRVLEDPELSDEGKQNRIAAIHNRLGPKIEGESQQARDKAAKWAKRYAERSAPFPGGSLAGAQVKDTAELMAIQNEAATIAQMVQSGGLTEKIEEKMGRRVKNVKEPGDRTLTNLRALYGEALEETGFEARIKGHAVLRAAKQLGYDDEAVYGPFRTSAQEEALAEARRYQQAAAMIPTAVPSLERSVRAGGSHWRKAGSVRQGGSIFKKQRKPSWK